MSCNSILWIPGNAQEIRVVLRDEDGSPATGLSLTGYVLPAADSDLVDAVASVALSDDGNTPGGRQYSGTLSAAAQSALVVGTTYYVVVAGTNYRSAAQRILYAFEDPSLVPA